MKPTKAAAHHAVEPSVPEVPPLSPRRGAVGSKCACIEGCAPAQEALASCTAVALQVGLSDGSFRSPRCRPSAALWWLQQAAIGRDAGECDACSEGAGGLAALWVVWAVRAAVGRVPRHEAAAVEASYAVVAVEEADAYYYYVLGPLAVAEEADGCFVPGPLAVSLGYRASAALPDPRRGRWRYWRGRAVERRSALQGHQLARGFGRRSPSQWLPTLDAGTQQGGASHSVQLALAVLVLVL
jgi:hypothetical protein